MNTTLTSILTLNRSNALRLAVVVATLSIVASQSAARDHATSDRAAQLLATHSSLPVKNAGPYVERGTFQIQVAVKLGQPTAKLGDSAWLYQDYQVEDSDAHGTLVVRFSPQGRVSNLTLVTPAVATAMLTPANSPEKVLVAATH